MEKLDVYEKFAEKALSYLNNTEAFLKEQLPDFFQQVITYNMVMAIVTVAFSAAMIWLGYVLLNKSIEMKKASDRKWLDDTYVLPLIAGCVLMGAFTLIGMSNVSTLIKTTMAPKVFIVDYLRGKE